MQLRKLAGGLVAISLLTGPVLALAETSTTSTNNAQIQAMLTQIQALQAQIQALKTAQTQLQTAQTNLGTTLGLIRNLKQGMTGEDVKALQAILAADPTIYPEGTISGFYGRLTSEAVKKFQKKHGFESVGFVGPKTLKKLNELVKELGLENEGDEEDSDNDGNRSEKRLCAKIPPGHLIAPGWLKKNDRPVVPECQKLPKGIEDKKHGNNSNSSTTPWISNKASASVVVGGNIFDTVTLMFGNSPTGTIALSVYGPGDTLCTTPLTPALANVTVTGNGTYSSGNFTTTSVGTYRFIASYSGDSKNKPVSTKCTDSTASVNVTAVPDTTAPVISLVGTANLLGTTTNIVWTTVNDPSTSKVWYGTVTPISTIGAPNVTDTNFVTNHSVPLSGLATSTTYYFVVGSTDTEGNTATSSQNTFTTTAGL